MSWTIKTLKKYIDLRFKDLNKSIKIAKKLMNSRLNGMNHIHKQLVKQNITFVTKPELQLRDQKIEMLQRLVFIGFGICIAVEIFIYIIFK
jgi:hypothetical protein